VSTNVKRQYEWMWTQAVDLADEAARLQRRFLRYLGPAGDAVSWEPPVDVHESDEGLILNFALPGVSPDSIELRLEPHALTVSALRRPRVTGCGATIRRLEIPYGRFVRRVALTGPAVRIADSRYLNGCLEVRLVSADTHEQ
jgi:HSP20 family protein